MTDRLDHLARFDTPTICNALDALAPEMRLAGYTRRPVVAAPAAWTAPDGHCAICARARTVRIRASAPHPRSAEDTARLKSGYYDWIAGQGRCLMVVEDLDPAPLGAFWGEVNSALHLGLGAVGCVTNGVVRDLDDLAPSFLILAGLVGPSHAHVHWIDYGQGASVLGMDVAEGEVVHADRHGAVRIPEAALEGLPDAIAAVQDRERPLIEAARAGMAPAALARRMREILGAAEGEDAR